MTGITHIDSLELLKERDSYASRGSSPSVGCKKFKPLSNFEPYPGESWVTALKHRILELDFRQDALIFNLDAVVRWWQLPKLA